MGRGDADPQSGHRPLNIRFIRGDSQKAISVVAGLRFFIDPCLSKENSRACAHSKPKTSTCSTCGRTTLPCGASAERSRPFRGTRSGVSSTNSASTSTPHGSCGWSSRPLDGRAVGLVDLFEFEPVDLRAGIGILIHGAGDRGRGFASDALDVLCRYARQVLGLHQLWCSVAPDNAASLTLFRRAGFVECGRKREWRRTPDGWADELLLQKIF